MPAHPADNLYYVTLPMIRKQRYVCSGAEYDLKKLEDERGRILITYDRVLRANRHSIWVTSETIGGTLRHYYIDSLRLTDYDDLVCSPTPKQLMGHLLRRAKREGLIK